MILGIDGHRPPDCKRKPAEAHIGDMWAIQVADEIVFLTQLCALLNAIWIVEVHFLFRALLVVLLSISILLQVMTIATVHLFAGCKKRKRWKRQYRYFNLPLQNKRWSPLLCFLWNGWPAARRTLPLATSKKQPQPCPPRHFDYSLQLSFVDYSCQLSFATSILLYAGTTQLSGVWRSSWSSSTSLLPHSEGLTITAPAMAHLVLWPQNTLIWGQTPNFYL